MIDLLEKKNDIVKVLFVIDFFFLVMSFFYTAKLFIITIAIINVLLLGSFLIIKKYALFFGMISETNKMAKGLNGALGSLYG